MKRSESRSRVAPVREGRAGDGRLVLNRRSVARAASAVGALALIVAIFALLAQHDVTALVFVSALVAVVGIGAWTVLAPDDLRTLVSGRQALYGSNSVFVTVLFAGSVAILYALTAGAGITADLTSLGYYSLKSDVRPVINNLDRPIQITAFYSRKLLAQQSNDAPVLRIFADAAPDKIRLVFVDPDEQPLVAKEFGLSEAFGIYVSYLTQQGTPDLNQTVAVRGISGIGARENWIAEAILQLQARGKYHVLFTVGNNELGTDRDKEEVAWRIRDGMEQVGVETGTIDLRNQDVPPGTTALVMLGPRLDFTKDQVNRVARYLAGGGKLLLMAEPAYEGAITFMVPPDSPMATYLWESWGIRPQRDIVYDPASFQDSPYYVLAAKVNTTSRITQRDDLGGARTRPLFHIVQSWELSTTPPAGVQATVLFQSSDQSFGKLKLREIAQNPDRAVRETSDLPGPLVLVAALENATSHARLILVGDADWIQNGAVDPGGGVVSDESVLWTRMIDWLTQFLERVTVNPVAVQLPLRASTSDLNLTATITLLVLPALVLAVGVFVVWRRGRR